MLMLIYPFVMLPKAQFSFKISLLIL